MLTYLIPVFAAALAAQASDPLAPTASPTTAEAAQDCEAHVFETVVTADVGGTQKRSRLKLCGMKGQTDAQFLDTLKDSAAKIAASDSIPGPMRAAMVEAVTGEITRLKTVLVALREKPAAPAGPISIKPRAPVKPADDSLAQYGALPQLPAPKPDVRASLDAPPPTKLANVVAPDINFTCFEGGGLELACSEFSRSTTLIAKANSAVAPGASLSFRLDGDERANVALGAIAKRRSKMIPLPGTVCRGTNGGSLEVEVMVAPKGGGLARSVETLGPYDLRC